MAKKTFSEDFIAGFLLAQKLARLQVDISIDRLMKASPAEICHLLVEEDIPCYDEDTADDDDEDEEILEDYDMTSPEPDIGMTCFYCPIDPKTKWKQKKVQVCVVDVSEYPAQTAFVSVVLREILPKGTQSPVREWRDIPWKDCFGPFSN